MRQVAVILNCGSLFFVDHVGIKIYRIFSVNIHNDEMDWSLGDFTSRNIRAMRASLKLSDQFYEKEIIAQGT